MKRPCPRRRLEVELLEARCLLADVSAPAMLQFFEGTYQTIERRAADIFNAGYGAVYTPPPGRADLGNFSVGYDVYDRFDLGSPGNPTLYGSETGLKTAIDTIHRLGGNFYIDFVVNHNGFSDLGTPGFAAAGGYPGFLLTAPFDIDGDFHGRFEGGDIRGRLAGLIDIAQEKNYRYVRHPVPGFANNLPAGTTPQFGRLANVPNAYNRRFYPDQALAPIIVFDPRTGEANLRIHPFNSTNPLAGDPVAENGMGYLMRYAQWMVQAVGVDGFRIDAAKHVEQFVLNFHDRAVYRSSPRRLLDGSQPNIFSFSEAYDGNRGYLQQFIRKDINPADPGRVGGNRDVLDFPLYFALRDNLTGNGFQNDWRNIVNASQDAQDDGLGNNGSQGVSFVSSHDDSGAYLGNVAHAYTLLRPGNAVVYFNAREFGADRDFPNDGRGDALGGLYGDALTRLVNLRNTYGRGNYIPRALEKEFLVFERDRSALVVLSNRLDGGFDSRTVQTNFAPGTPLIELTGNASSATVDPFNDFPELLVVNGDGTVNLRVPRNRAPGKNGALHNRGYFVYGPATPQGALSLTNIAQVLEGETPTTATNGTARLADIDVIKAASFQVRLNTNRINLLGFFRDRPADGDNALIRIDEGSDLNGNGRVDFVQPGATSYGFEQFTTVHSPGYLNSNGNGSYVQTIDTTRLAEGYHFITVRAFRHREDGGPAVFTDFRQTVYVDRLPPDSILAGVTPIPGVNLGRRMIIRSTDLTADNVHVFVDLPGTLSDAEVLARIGGASQMTRTDRDLFTKDFSGVTLGNRTITVVTFEITGNHRIQRFIRAPVGAAESVQQETAGLFPAGPTPADLLRLLDDAGQDSSRQEAELPLPVGRLAAPTVDAYFQAAVLSTSAGLDDDSGQQPSPERAAASLKPYLEHFEDAGLEGEILQAVDSRLVKG